MSGQKAIRNFMDQSFVTLRPEMDVYQAIDIMMDKRLTGAVVTDEDMKVVGILSEKDCLKLLREDSYYELPGGKVKDFMTKDVFTIKADLDIHKVADILLQKVFRRLVIVDDQNKMIGQITRRDLLRTIRRMHQDAGKKNKKIAPIL